MRIVEFSVLGIPQSKGSAKSWAKAFRDPATGQVKVRSVVTSANQKLKPWEDDIRAAIQVHAYGIYFETPVTVRLEFHMPRPISAPKRVILPAVAPDLDKLCRGALDALTGKLWKDDSLVVALTAMKVYAVGQPKAVYRIAEVVGPTPLDDAGLSLPY